MNKHTIMALLSILFMISSSCNQDLMDLDKLTFEEDISRYTSIIDIKEKREINLARDYDFFRMDDNGAIEKNKKKKIHDCYINATNNKNVSFKDVFFEKKILIRIVDNIIIGYESETDITENSEKLFSSLEKKFGKGKLIYDNGADSKIFMWNNNGLIVKLSTLKLSNRETNKTSIGSILVIAKEQALKEGLWPQHKNMPSQILEPPIILSSDY